MFGLAFVTLIGLIYAIEPDKILDAMSEIEYSLLILAVILYLINTVIKAMRWRLIVSSTGTDLGYVEAFRLFLCGLAVNNTTPGGVSGEPLRVMLLRYKKGTPTGEGLSTIFSERLIDLTVEVSNGRVPVMAGTGSNSTEEAINLTKYAKKAGADSALIVMPYYNKPTQSGLMAHFNELIKNSSKPIIIYDIPGRSVIKMDDFTMAKLAKNE